MLSEPPPTNIPTLVVAIYAALVSTVIGIVQLLNFLRDRDKIKVTVRRDMRIFNDPRYENMTLTILRVANAGRRPVTITSVGAECLFPNDHWVCTDTNPALPHEIDEGQYLLAQIDQTGLNFSIIQSWFAHDALGRTHRLDVAPWYKRWVSTFRLKRKAKEQRKQKARAGR